MKKMHIIGLVLIAASIAAIIGFSNDYTTYESFSVSKQKEGKVFKVVGHLVEDIPFEYEPLKDPNRFVFHMIDRDSLMQKVVYGAPMPQDFERSEQIVITGKSKGDVFYADKILMKCPSKYIEDEIEVIEVSAEDEKVAQASEL